MIKSQRGYFMLSCISALCALLQLNLLTKSTFAFEYPNFNSVAGLNVLGDAAQFGDRLRLTPAEEGQVGGVWYSAKVPVANGFKASFSFEVSDPDPDFGADGFAFIIQNQSATALGVGGSSLGFMDIGDGPGLDNFLAVEFDTLNSGITFDNDGNHIAVQSLRKEFPKSREFLGAANPPFSIQGGGVHTAEIIYEPGLLRIAVDGSATPVLQINTDIVSLLGLLDGQAWVGFTGATGGAWENHDILNWTFNSIPEPSTLVAAQLCWLAIVAHRPYSQRRPGLRT